ncbi:hypothetical protein [Streptomyces sp. MJP52]|uniref:hypothetical protein n=1 Tax=Streptomyces sp. MJP52 TaxID=2940555 RepID=UPI00247702ED|nr:hypothetical protein [Streptomyces sp. MJP52]MDH6224127.1 hypothetical protein [Streptomyces sp. MJP52]
METGRFRAPPAAVDGALVLGVTALLLGGGLSAGRPGAPGLALLAAGGLALAARRRAPRGTGGQRSIRAKTPQPRYSRVPRA